jgi:hypothetical protein
MQELPKSIDIALDLAGCPNRCMHCWLGTEPNKRLSEDKLRQVAGLFRNWVRPGDTKPYFEQVDVYSWYREPDFSDNYRQLYELERELSGRQPERFELLSIWRICRDSTYLAWAKDRGPKTCQISSFGGEENTDRHYGRAGAFADAVKATNLLLDNGMVPRWQIFLLKPTIPDLGMVMHLIEDLDIRKRTGQLGEEFKVFCHPPGADGNGWGLEDIRIEESDLGSIPAELMDSTKAHFGGDIDWMTEAESIRQIESGTEMERQCPSVLSFHINANLDVYSNYGDLTDPWRLGNIERDSVTDILDTFTNDRSPGMQASFHVSQKELAKRYGRRESKRLYSGGDVITRWVKMHLSEGQSE